MILAKEIATDCCINEFPRAPDKASAFLTSLNNALVSSSYSRGTYTLRIVDPILFIKNFVPVAYLQPNAQIFDFAVPLPANIDLEFGSSDVKMNPPGSVIHPVIAPSCIVISAILFIKGGYYGIY